MIQTDVTHPNTWYSTQLIFFNLELKKQKAVTNRYVTVTPCYDVFAASQLDVRLGVTSMLTHRNTCVTVYNTSPLQSQVSIKKARRNTVLRRGMFTVTRGRLRYVLPKHVLQCFVLWNPDFTTCC